MTELDKLMQELCPNGVPFCELSEVLTIKNGKDYKSFNEGDIPVYGSGGIMTYIDASVYDKPSVLIPRKGSLDKLYYVDTPFWNVDTIFYTEIKECIVIPKFIYYCLQKQHLERLNKAGGVPSLTQSILNKVVIPAPPIAVQREIVRILDSFTELTAKLSAKLSAELTARKKQYECCSVKLFLQGNYDFVPMEELADFVYGYTDKAQTSGDARFVRITDINDQGYLKAEDIKYITMTDEAKKSLLKKGDIIMARTGATYGKTLYFDSDFPSVYASFLIKIIPCDRLLSKYYWHFTKTPLYWEQANKLVTIGGQPQFNTPALKKIRVPVPPIKEQERIIDILDRLDALCNNISADLPAEIEARQKQYDYYRDKLLTFKEVEA